MYRYFLSSCELIISAKSRGKQCRWAGYPLIIYFVLCQSREKSNPNPAAAHLGWQVTGLQGKALPSAFLSTKWGSPKLPRQGKGANAGLQAHMLLCRSWLKRTRWRRWHSHCVLKDNSHSQEPQILFTPDHTYLLLSCGDILMFLFTLTQNVMAII